MQFLMHQVCAAIGLSVKQNIGYTFTYIVKAKEEFNFINRFIYILDMHACYLAREDIYKCIVFETIAILVSYFNYSSGTGFEPVLLSSSSGTVDECVSLSATLSHQRVERWKIYRHMV